MRLICSKENLVRGLCIVSRSIDPKASLPVLSSILLETKNGRLKLSSTNLEIGVTCHLGSIIKEEGKFAAPAKIFNNYITALPAEKIELKSAGETLEILAGDFKAEIKGPSAEDFPLIPKTEKEVLSVVSGKVFREALAKVAFAAAIDESRPEIAGVFFNFGGDKIFEAATDGYRLAEARLSGVRVSEDMNLILPLRTVNELTRVLTGDEDEVKIYVTEGQMKFLFKDAVILNSEVEITSKLVEGKYPDYQAIIPKEFQLRTIFFKDELVKAIKAVSLFAKKETNGINLELKSDSKEMILSAESSTLGRNSVNLKGEMRGQGLKIAFNASYLLEGLGALESNEVELNFSSSGGPALLRDKGVKNYLYVVMPLEVS